MSKIEKCVKWFKLNGIECHKVLSSNSLPTVVLDIDSFCIEVSQEEIDYRAELYSDSEEQNEDT